MATIQNATGLSLAGIAQQLTPGSTPQQELRSKGTDLYVKQSTAFFSKEQSRTDHRNNALAIVQSAIQSDLGLTAQQAQDFMQRVTGSRHAQTQITTGDLHRLTKAVDFAKQLGDAGQLAASQGRMAEALGREHHLPDSASVDIVKSLGGNAARGVLTALSAGRHDDVRAQMQSQIELKLGLTPIRAQAFLDGILGGHNATFTAADVTRVAKGLQLAGQVVGGDTARSAAIGIAAEALVNAGVPENAVIGIATGLGAAATQDVLLALETNDIAGLRRVLATLPNTRATVDSLLKLENALIAKADSGNTTPPVLTVRNHDAFHTKRTEALEHVLQGKLNGNATPELGILSQLPKEEYWRLLMDGKHQAGNDKFFFDRSKGYMASMLAGLDMVVDKVGMPLSVDMIKELHKVSTTSVTYELPVRNGALRSIDFQIAGTIKTERNIWGVCKDFTDKGMQELQALRDDLEDHVPSGEYFVNENLVADQSRAQQVQSWSAGLNIGSSLSQEVEDLMQYAIDTGAREIGRAGADNDRKIGAIVDTCRRLGCIHPFKDANGRLVMFLILNKMLTDNGMSPTILQDQGHMIGKSRAELVALIKAGQTQVELLTP